MPFEFIQSITFGDMHELLSLSIPHEEVRIHSPCRMGKKWCWNCINFPDLEDADLLLSTGMPYKISAV